MCTYVMQVDHLADTLLTGHPLLLLRTPLSWRAALH